MTILPPTNRKDFKSEKEYKESLKEWKRNFNKLMKEMRKGGVHY